MTTPEVNLWKLATKGMVRRGGMPIVERGE